MGKRRDDAQEKPAISEEDLAWRMGSGAGRRLESRLDALGWDQDSHRATRDGEDGEQD